MLPLDYSIRFNHNKRGVNPTAGNLLHAVQYFPTNRGFDRVLVRLDHQAFPLPVTCDGAQAD